MVMPMFDTDNIKPDMFIPTFDTNMSSVSDTDNINQGMIIPTFDTIDLNQDMLIPKMTWMI